eukprot:2762557-Pyramimonas_sp.AAC.1
MAGCGRLLSIAVHVMDAALQRLAAITLCPEDATALFDCTSGSTAPATVPGSASSPVLKGQYSIRTQLDTLVADVEKQ